MEIDFKLIRNISLCLNEFMLSVVVKWYLLQKCSVSSVCICKNVLVAKCLSKCSICVLSIVFE